MLRVLLCLGSTMSMVTAYCNRNAPKGECEASKSFFCQNKCLLSATQNSCKATPGCNWTIYEDLGATLGYCPDLTYTDCSVLGNETACTANQMCAVEWSPCVFSNYCYRSNSSVSPSDCYIDQAPNCASNPNCVGAVSCGASFRCNHGNQSSCVAEAGCYWSEYTMDGQTASSCDKCFTDYTNTENEFLTAQARVGKFCSVPANASIGIKFHKVVSSATGCSGGNYAPTLYLVCDPPLAESNSPTTKLSAQSLVMISSIVMLLLAE